MSDTKEAQKKSTKKSDLEELKKRAKRRAEELRARSGETKKRFEIKQWNAIGLWSYVINTDMCAICKENIYQPCVECTANSISIPTLKMAEEKESVKKMCTIAFGTCRHGFHWHCIDKWMSMAHDTAAKCPVCGSKWQFAEYDSLLK